MASGRGERLRPITYNWPKPLITICNKAPIVQTVEQAIHTAGVKDFYFKTRYQAGLIQYSLGHGDKFGAEVNFHYVVERRGVDTAGGTKEIVSFFNFPKTEPFWVLSGDIFSPETELGKIAYAHQIAAEKFKALATIGFKLMPVRALLNRFGVAVVNKDNLVERFAEKPRTTEEAKKILEEITHPGIKALNEKTENIDDMILPINASFYLLEGNFFDEVPQTKELGWDFGKDVFPSEKLRNRINAVLLDTPWWDVGTPEDYWRAQWYFYKLSLSSIPGQFIKDWGHIGQRVNLDAQTKANMNDSVIGNGATIKNCILDHAIIGEGSHLEDVEIKWSVVLPWTYVNLRPCSEKISKINYSIIGGSPIGGGFIDPQSTGLKEIEDKVVIPDDRRVISPLSLNLTPKQKEEAK
jgi:NDP-sugar pyrophosphorylase family protein